MEARSQKHPKLYRWAGLAYLGLAVIGGTATAISATQAPSGAPIVLMPAQLQSPNFLSDAMKEVPAKDASFPILFGGPGGFDLPERAEVEDLEPIRFEVARVRLIRTLWRRADLGGQIGYVAEDKDFCRITARQPVFDLRPVPPTDVVRILPELVNCTTTDENGRQLTGSVSIVSVIHRWNPMDGSGPSQENFRGFYNAHMITETESQRTHADRGGTSVISRDLEASGIITEANNGVNWDRENPPETLVSFRSVTEYAKP